MTSAFRMEVLKTNRYYIYVPLSTHSVQYSQMSSYQMRFERSRAGISAPSRMLRYAAELDARYPGPPFAACSNIYIMTSECPPNDASCSGVQPPLFCTWTFAPCSTNSRATSSLPLCAARCNGVLPSLFAASVSASCSNKNRKMSRYP